MDCQALADKLSEKLSVHEMKILSGFVSNNTIDVNDLLNLTLQNHQQIAFRAAWILEHVAYNNEQAFKQTVPQFLNAYPTIENKSVKRHFTKILMRLSSKKNMQKWNLKVQDFNKCLAATFDWLLHPNTPLAVQCNALDIIFTLASYDDWISEELKLILEQKLVSNSPSLISRSKRILKYYNSK